MAKQSRDSIVAKKAREKSVVAKQQEIQAQHKAFADALLEGHSHSDAARAAGYHPSNATQVMRQESVQMYLNEGRKEISEVTTLKRLDVLEIFLEAIDMARTLADPGQMINGADKVAKMMGFYEPEKLKIEVETNSKALANKFKQLTDAELLEIAAGRATVIEGETLPLDRSGFVEVLQ